MRIEFIKDNQDIQNDMKCISSIGRISRSKRTLKENFNELSFKQHLEFNEKWYKQSQHRSLGDLASIHLDISGVSIIGAKLLEIARIGVGFCEFSTRYVDMEKNNFEDLFFAPGWLDENHGIIYKEISQYHINNYKDFKNTPEIYSKKDLLDSARYFLPVSIKVGLGIHTNVRALESIMIKMKWYSALFTEAKLIYENLKKLIINNDSLLSTIDIDKIEAINLFEKAFTEKNNRIYYDLMNLFYYNIFGRKPNGINKILDITEKFFDKILKTSKYWSNPDLTIRDLDDKDIFKEFDQCEIQNMGNNIQYTDIIKEFIGKNIKLFHNEDLYIPRIAEFINFHFACSMDFGSFRDISRHRMCSMYYLPVPLNINLNESTFKDICEDKYYINPLDAIHKNNYYFKNTDFIDFQRKRYKVCEDLIQDLRSQSYIDNYIVIQTFVRCIEFLSYTQPLSANIDFGLTINFREAIKLINQRETKAGHPSYVNFAKKLREEIEKVLGY